VLLCNINNNIDISNNSNNKNYNIPTTTINQSNRLIFQPSHNRTYRLIVRQDSYPHLVTPSHCPFACSRHSVTSNTPPHCFTFPTKYRPTVAPIIPPSYRSNRQSSNGNFDRRRSYSFDHRTTNAPPIVEPRPHPTTVECLLVRSYRPSVLPCYCRTCSSTVLPLNRISSIVDITCRSSIVLKGEPFLFVLLSCM
jgi:hypothetical protein